MEKTFKVNLMALDKDTRETLVDFVKREGMYWDENAAVADLEQRPLHQLVENLLQATGCLNFDMTDEASQYLTTQLLQLVRATSPFLTTEKLQPADSAFSMFVQTLYQHCAAQMCIADDHETFWTSMREERDKRGNLRPAQAFVIRRGELHEKSFAQFIVLLSNETESVYKGLCPLVNSGGELVDVDPILTDETDSRNAEEINAGLERLNDSPIHLEEDND